MILDLDSKQISVEIDDENYRFVFDIYLVSISYHNVHRISNILKEYEH